LISWDLGLFTICDLKVKSQYLIWSGEQFLSAKGKGRLVGRPEFFLYIKRSKLEGVNVA
jgi:hypothetical protein